MEASEKGLRAEVTTSYLRLTDAAIRAATLPPGKSQHYLHDTEQPGLAIRTRATGGRTRVCLFTKPGMRGTQRKTLGAWPKFDEKAARKAATWWNLAGAMGLLKLESMQGEGDKIVRPRQLRGEVQSAKEARAG